MLGIVHRAQGKLTAARRELEQSLQMWRRTRYYLLLESFVELGRVELAEGNTAAARTQYEEAAHGIEQFDTANSLYMVAVWLGLGCAAQAEGNPSEAGEMFRKALAFNNAMPWEKMEGIAGCGEVAWRQGHREEAVELLVFVVEHPFTAYAQRQKAKLTLRALQAQVAPDVFAARVKAGKLRNLDDTLTELRGLSALA